MLKLIETWYDNAIEKVKKAKRPKRKFLVIKKIFFSFLLIILMSDYFSLSHFPQREESPYF